MLERLGLSTIDLRCPYEELDTIEAEFREIAQDISAEGMTFSIDRISECPPVRFDKIAISCVRAAGEGHSGKDMCREMDSAAGHDRYVHFSES